MWLCASAAGLPFGLIAKQRSFFHRCKEAGGDKKQRARKAKANTKAVRQILGVNRVRHAAMGDGLNAKPCAAEQINEKSNELVELKTKIHKANTPVYDKIFRLSELKSTISRLKSLDCSEGVSNDYYSRNRENPPVKTAEVSVVDRDEMVKFMEEQIEDLQDILDNHNQNTEI